MLSGKLSLSMLNFSNTKNKLNQDKKLNVLQKRPFPSPIRIVQRDPQVSNENTNADSG